MSAVDSDLSARVPGRFPEQSPWRYLYPVLSIALVAWGGWVLVISENPNCITTAWCTLYLSYVLIDGSSVSRISFHRIPSYYYRAFRFYGFSLWLAGLLLVFLDSPSDESLWVYSRFLVVFETTCRLAPCIIICIFICCLPCTLWMLPRYYHRPNPNTHGASLELLAKLVRFRFNDRLEFGTDIPVKCPVCLDEYEETDELTLLPCSHCYHSTCIDQWLAQSQLCPICRSHCLG
jgi:Ring finger domain